MTKATGVGRGRPRGARNKRNVETEKATKAAAEKIEEVLPGAFIGDAHAYLMTIYKDPTLPVATRIDAAGKALPYEKSRLAAIEHFGDPKRPLEQHHTHTLDRKSAELVASLVK